MGPSVLFILISLASWTRVHQYEFRERMNSEWDSKFFDRQALLLSSYSVYRVPSVSSSEAHEDDEQGPSHGGTHQSVERTPAPGCKDRDQQPWMPKLLSASVRWGRDRLPCSAHGTRLLPDSSGEVILHPSTPLGSRGLAQGPSAGIKYTLPFIIYL